jgi:hypothetical protein
MVWVLAHRLTMSPASLQHFWDAAERLVSTVSDDETNPTPPFRQVVAGYKHLAGIESGYGFFAPNVGNSYWLMYQLHYPDGTIDYDLLRPPSDAAGIRFASLLDIISRTEDESLRETMIKMLAFACWREHPRATEIRTKLGELVLPSVQEFVRGKPASYRVLYEYDFQHR